MNQPLIRHDWTLSEIEDLLTKPWMDLLYEAQTTHRQYFNPHEVQRSTLLSIKTGGCSEDCGYCPQSAHYDTGLKKESLWNVEDVISKAKEAKASGASRFCMGAAWRSLHDKDLPAITRMVKEVKELGLETCMTLGMLKAQQAQTLKEAGLDYYNHNIDTSKEFYPNIISTRRFEDRLETLEHVREAGISVCCGGIVGLGESLKDRASMLHTLSTMAVHPESVPINRLVAVEGTPLANGNPEEVDIFEFVRTIAVARILMPGSMIRLSAGRETMSEEAQTLCFMAGANSIFLGDKLLTTKNPGHDRDASLFDKLGLIPMERRDVPCAA